MRSLKLTFDVLLKKILLREPIVLFKFLSAALALSLLGFSHLTAANSMSPNSPFKVFLAKDGMNIGFVEVIYQDRVGYMWFGGGQGLIRYDGHNFDKFIHESDVEGSLSHSTVRCIVEDSKGRMWLSTEKGLNLYDRATDTFRSFFTETSMQNIIWGIDVDKDDNLWLATVGGFAKFDTREEKFEFLDDPRANQVNDYEFATSGIYIDANNIVWIAANGRGLLRVNPETMEIKAFVNDPANPKSLASNIIWDIIESQDGLLWLATEGGLNSFNRETEEFFHYGHDPSDPSSMSDPATASLVEDEGGNIVVGTGAGVNVLNRATGKFVRITSDTQNPRSIANPKIRSVFIDHKNDLWVGSFPQGVSYFNRNNAAFETFMYDKTTDTGINHSSILSFEEESPTRLWVGTDGGGLNLFDQSLGKPRYFVPDPTNRGSSQSPRGAGILDVELDFDGSLWVGTWGEGVSHYIPSEDKFIHYLHDPNDPFSLLSNNVWTILSDSKRNLWVGTIGGGVSRYDRENDNFVSYPYKKDNPESLSSVFVWALYEGEKGEIWVGTHAGLDRLDPATSKFKQFAHDPEDSSTLSSGTVVALHGTQDGYLWVGTEGGGLNRFDSITGEVVRFGSRQGLQNLDALSIEEDRNGNLWIGTRGGLSQFDRKAQTFRNFDVSNGLQGNQFNMGSSATLSDGRLLFGGTNGYTRVDPDKLISNDITPKVVLKDLKLLNKSVQVGEEGGVLTQGLNITEQITLNYKQRMFTFDFTALNFRNPERNQYAYKLEGFDIDWLYVGSQRSATYTNLDAGLYTLKIKAADYEGLWSEQPKMIKILVLPPPWQTWWAYTIYVFMVLASIYAMIDHQRKKRKRAEEQARILEIKVAERTAELRVKNNDIQAMLSNMHQGLFTIQDDRSIHHEYSHYLEEIFERGNIAGMDFGDLLFNGANLGHDALEQLDTAIMSVVGEDELNFVFNNHLFILEYDVVINGQLKKLSLDWSPIIEEEVVTKLMVSVRDVTKLKAMEEEAEAQRRELDIIAQLLKVPEDRFFSFDKASKRFLQQSRELLEAASTLSKDNIATLFRNMHTIKGNSRTYGFSFLCDVAHDAESVYSELKDNPASTEVEVPELIEHIDTVESVLSEYATIFSSVLGHKDAAEGMDNEGIQRPLSKILSDIVSSLPSIALDLDKANPVVKFNDANIAFDEETGQVLNDVFAHILRNCVDHGIEQPSARLGKGKNASGTILIDVSKQANHIHIRTKDDGQGMNLDRLFDIGVKQGKWKAEERPQAIEIANIVFSSGVSTKEKVTDISGRGVGMDAVKQFLLDRNGDIKINLLEKEDPDSPFAPFEFEITL